MTSQQLLKKMFPPMLATLADQPPANDEQWAYEMKYDGFRAVIGIVGSDVTMWSRNQIDLASRFPKSFDALKKIRANEVVLDGEVVVLDAHGAPRFQLLQTNVGREQLIIFDILWLDGADLRRKPYVERRAILEKFLKKAPAGIAVAQQLPMSGAAALAHAAKGGWEGIIAKRKTSLYETRRSKEWLKLKALQQQEFVIIGWQPSTHSDREIGSLHIAVNEGGSLRYAGKVGTGFNAKMRVWLRDELAKDVVPASPAKETPRIRDATWVKPRLVGEVAFTEWTSDHRLRHPSFLGLREDKKPKEVVREMPTVTLTNPTRVLYPRDKITKTDLAAYYDAVAEPMLHALRGRPLALEHWNQGIDKPSWFQQSLGKEAPNWLTIVDTPTRTTKSGTAAHLIADSREVLRWLAQMSVLTTHMWSSRMENLEQPDWILFDLDPAKGKGIEQAIEAAGVMRRLLEQLELPSVPKTSGKRGIHVFVPLAPGYSHEEALDFGCMVAAGVAAKVPGITVERSLAKRRGRLYLDCMQNGYGKIVVAPYSPRAIDGAPVSAPLKWSEITKKLDPLKYNIRTMPNRLAKVGDLFAPALENGVKLPQLR